MTFQNHNFNIVVMKKKAVINEDLLLYYGATEHEYKTCETIFNAGSEPLYYYQIRTGQVKLTHTDECKELIQSILAAGDSVCGLLLSINKSYPVNAVSLDTSKILRLAKNDFFKLIDNNPEILSDINKFISEQLYQKFMLAPSNLSLSAEIRLKGVLNYLRELNTDQSKHTLEISLTRKQLASITALNIQTVIRTIKKLEEQEYLKIIKRKIFI